jgi:hypothetical protein
MKAFSEMSLGELRAEYKARCVAYLASHYQDSDIGMTFHSNVMSAITEETERRDRLKRTFAPVIIEGGRR